MILSVGAVMQTKGWNPYRDCLMRSMKVDVANIGGKCLIVFIQINKFIFCGRIQAVIEIISQLLNF
jgi:dimeric dUTPase (all-alpha-NTP-PPase superfamily)